MNWFNLFWLASSIEEIMRPTSSYGIVRITSAVPLMDPSVPLLGSGISKENLSYGSN